MKVSLDCQSFVFDQKVPKGGSQQASNKQKVFDFFKNVPLALHFANFLTEKVPSNASN